MIKYFILFSVLCSNTLAAQNINLIVKDTISLEKISFVKVYSHVQHKSFYSNKNGELTKLVENDTLELSCPGYLPSKVYLNNKNRDIKVVYLKQHVEQLEPVILSVNKKQVVSLGNSSKKTSLKHKYSAGISAIFIENTKENLVFKKLKFKLRNKNKVEEVYVRPVIFLSNEKKEVKKQILNKNIVIKVEDKNEYNIDISDLYLNLPIGSFYVGLELINGTGFIEIDCSVSKNDTNHFSFFIFNNQKKILSHQLNMSKGKKRFPLNFMFEIEAY